MLISDIDEILSLLEAHEHRNRKVINMVPSESCCSMLAKLPMLLDGYHRYFFNDTEDPDEWHFRGAQDLASIETKVAIPLLKKLMQARYVNLRPLSGLHAMILVLAALAKSGSTVFCLSPKLGGHYATAEIAARFGLNIHQVSGSDPYTVDLVQLSVDAEKLKPSLVYVDQCHGLFPLNIHDIVGAIRVSCPSAIVHVDASHWLGLILGGVINNPLNSGADSFGGSTHKTFPGPHKAVFATNRDDLAEAVKAMQFYLVSNHNFGSVMSLAIALLEFRYCGGNRYAAMVLDNSRALGHELVKRGIHVVASDRGCSSGHQLWVLTTAEGIDALTASERLYQVGIRANVIPDLPGLKEPALRLGINEATFHGLCIKDMETLSAIISDAVRGVNLETASKSVQVLRQQYHSPYTFESKRPDLIKRAIRLIADTWSKPTQGEMDA